MQNLAATDPPIECPTIIIVGSGYFLATKSKTEEQSYIKVSIDKSSVFSNFLEKPCPLKSKETNYAN